MNNISATKCEAYSVLSNFLCSYISYIIQLGHRSSLKLCKIRSYLSPYDYCKICFFDFWFFVTIDWIWVRLSSGICSHGKNTAVFPCKQQKGSCFGPTCDTRHGDQVFMQVPLKFCWRTNFLIATDFYRYFGHLVRLLYKITNWHKYNHNAGSIFLSCIEI